MLIVEKENDAIEMISYSPRYRIHHRNGPPVANEREVFARLRNRIFDGVVPSSWENSSFFKLKGNKTTFAFNSFMSQVHNIYA